MKTSWKPLLLVLCLPSSLFAADGLTVAAQIDGHSQLIIQPDQVYWQHFLYARPGRHLTNQPTVLNGYNWYPQWPDSNDSGAARSASLPLVAGFSTNALTLTTESGRGSVSVFQLPSSDNGFTLIIDFNDPADGPDNYSVSIAGLSVVVPPQLRVQVASIALFWPTETNRSYLIQYASSVAPDAWLDLTTPIRGYGTNACFIDSVLGLPRRFYRVVPLP